MDFTTVEYYQWFLPCTFALAIIANRKSKNLRIWVLTLASYTFFWFASGWHLLLLGVSTLNDWIAGKNIQKSSDDDVKKRWLIGSLSLNLGLLAVFKYLDFLIETFNVISLKMPNSPQLDVLGIALPVGISFYTFQTMSYTIDIYRRKSEPYEKFIDFACYASFFPQLVAGPIVRADEFKQQLDSPMSINPAAIRLGLTLIVFGIFKKMVIGYYNFG